MWYGSNWMFGMHLLWWIFWIALVAVVIAILLLQQSRPQAPPPAQRSGPTPLEVLERRYAAGEISTDEFEERKAHLIGQHR
jgi:putative membrane protein